MIGADGARDHAYLHMDGRLAWEKIVSAVLNANAPSAEHWIMSFFCRFPAASCLEPGVTTRHVGHLTWTLITDR